MHKFLFLVLCSTILRPGLVHAAPETKPSAETVNQAPQVYGWELMTSQEREEYRAKMRALDTLEDREKFRTEHHEAMQARAKERGLTLPDMSARKRKGPRGKP